jgi:predicted DNA binding CopG/RHH family protein
MKKKTVKTPAKKSKVIKAKVSAVKKTSTVKKISKKPLAKTIKNTKAAKQTSSKKSIRKLVSIRILTSDIEAMRKKAAKIGIPYQTYINILIHRDAIGG